jgi:hypothetical protein
MSLPIRNSCFVPLLKGCSEPGVGYIAASLPSAAHETKGKCASEKTYESHQLKPLWRVFPIPGGKDYGSQTFWFLSLFLISLMGAG